MNMRKAVPETLAAPANPDQPSTRQFSRRDLLSLARSAAVAPIVAAPALSVSHAASTDSSNEL
ncbi:MAG: hypothetical protein QE272_13165, partial [Nevskia sp.]|nr:hypothetical protein [Nevskia sp.]